MEPALPPCAPACQNAFMRFFLGLVLLLGACAGEEGTLAATDEQFIETIVELRRAALEAGADTARFEDLRAAILEERGVTEDDLRAYVAGHADDLRHMATIWDTISARLSETDPR